MSILLFFTLAEFSAVFETSDYAFASVIVTLVGVLPAIILHAANVNKHSGRIWREVMITRSGGGSDGNHVNDHHRNSELGAPDEYYPSVDDLPWFISVDTVPFEQVVAALDDAEFPDNTDNASESTNNKHDAGNNQGTDFAASLELV